MGTYIYIFAIKHRSVARTGDAKLKKNDVYKHTIRYSEFCVAECLAWIYITFTHKIE